MSNAYVLRIEKGEKHKSTKYEESKMFDTSIKNVYK